MSSKFALDYDKYMATTVAILNGLMLEVCKKHGRSPESIVEEMISIRSKVGEMLHSKEDREVFAMFIATEFFRAMDDHSMDAATECSCGKCGAGMVEAFKDLIRQIATSPSVRN